MGGYFTTDTRHMLYGDDGSGTRLSITGRPQSTGPWPIPHPLSACGDTTEKMKGLFRQQETALKTYGQM